MAFKLGSESRGVKKGNRFGIKANPSVLEHPYLEKS